MENTYSNWDYIKWDWDRYDSYYDGWEKRYVGLTMHQQNFVPGSTARGNSICDAKIRNTTECRVSPILFDYYVPQKKRLRGVFLVIDSEFC